MQSLIVAASKWHDFVIAELEKLAGVAGGDLDILTVTPDELCDVNMPAVALVHGQDATEQIIGKRFKSIAEIRSESLQTEKGIQIIGTYSPASLKRTGGVESPYYQPFREDLQKALDAIGFVPAGEIIDKEDGEEEYAEPGTEEAGEDRMEPPRNGAGMTAAETLQAIRDRRAKLTQEEAKYNEPSDDAITACASCRFYLRDKTEEIGGCQVVDGKVAWFGTCPLYIGAREEAAFAFQSFVVDREELDERDAAFGKVSPARGETHEQFLERAMRELESALPDEIERRQKCHQLWNRSKYLPVGMMKSFDVEIEAPICKAAENPDFTYVLSPVLVPDSVDRQGDLISAAEIELAAHDFVESSQQAGLMHREMVSREQVVLVESYVARTPMTIGKTKITKGTWMAAWRVYNPELRALIKQGRLRGVSIGGRGIPS